MSSLDGGGSRISVLLIESSPVAARLVVDALAVCEQPGFDLCQVERLEDAVAVLAAGATDVVVLDLAHAAVGGLGGLARLRALAPDVAIVVRTADPGEELEISALEAGAQDVVRHGAGGTERVLARRLEHALARCRADVSTRWLAAIVDGSQDAIIAKTLDGTITSWNAGAERLYGYSAAEAIGQPIALLAASEADRDEFAGILDRVRRGEAIAPFDTVRRHRDGTLVSVSVTVSPVRDARGVVVGASAVAHDIRERVDAESKLRLAEEGFRTAFEEAPIGMALITPDGEWLRVNRAVCRILGFTTEELLATSCRGVTHPGDLSSDLDLQARMLAGELDGCRMPKRYLRKDGTTVWVDRSISLVRDAGGRPVHFIAQMEDVTDTRTAERELARANSQLRAIFDHIPLGISLRGPDGRYLQVNPYGAERHATTVEALVGRHPDDVLDPAVAARLRDTDAEMVRTGAPLTEQMQATGSDGVERDYQVVRYPIHDDGGEVIGFGACSLDVTERTRSERERERAIVALEEAQRIARVGSWTWRPADGVASWSQEMYRIFDRAPAAGGATGDEFLGYVHGADRDRVLEAYRSAVEGHPFELDYEITGGYGRRRHIHALGREDPERPGTFVGTVQDVTVIHDAEQRARAAQHRFREAFAGAPIGMAVVSLCRERLGCIESANAALTEVTGRPPELLAELTLDAIVHPDDRAAVRRQLAVLGDDAAARVQLEVRCLTSEGDAVWALLSGATVPCEADDCQQAVFHVMDIGERKRYEGQLRYLADHDALTGLFNRRRFEEELGRSMARAERYGEHFAVLMVDLDGFKRVNDTMGHSFGDELIIRVGTILRSTLRGTDVVARLGGDEFAAILTCADAQVAEMLSGKLLAGLEAQAMGLGEHAGLRVTASIGLTTYDGVATLGAEQLLVEADLAMYDAKQAGKNRIAVFSGERGATAPMAGGDQWLERVRAAVDEQGFALVAQPIRAIRESGSPRYELLLRLPDENGDLVPPSAFMAVAERFDLIQQIDRWVFAEAVRLLHVHHAAGHDLSLSVNMSGRTLSDPGLLADLQAILHTTPIPPRRLTVEVTETAAIVNLERAREVARALHSFGCEFALDDFGAGFASFYYLKHLEFDYLKIDGEFIRSLTDSVTDQLVVQSVVEIARALDAETVAEFVGDEAALDRLRALGVDYGQGYHLGPPRPVAELLPALPDAAGAEPAVRR